MGELAAGTPSWTSTEYLDLGEELLLRPQTLAGPLDRGHGRMTEDLRPPGASSLSERLRHIARLDVSVRGEVRCSDDTVQIEERE